MANSIFLARLIGPIFIAGAIGMLINGQAFLALADEFLRSRALIFLSGLLTMTAGMALVLTHNVWVANWPVLITFLGWLAAIGGAFRIISPQGTEQMGRAMLKKPMLLTAGGAAWLAIGAILCFFGYVR